MICDDLRLSKFFASSASCRLSTHTIGGQLPIINVPCEVRLPIIPLAHGYGDPCPLGGPTANYPWVRVPIIPCFVCLGCRLSLVFSVWGADYPLFLWGDGADYPLFCGARVPIIPCFVGRGCRLSLVCRSGVPIIPCFVGRLSLVLPIIPGLGVPTILESRVPIILGHSGLGMHLEGTANFFLPPGPPPCAADYRR